MDTFRNISLAELLRSESAVLKRIAMDIQHEEGQQVYAMPGHTKHLKAHSKAPPHNKYTFRATIPHDPEL